MLHSQFRRLYKQLPNRCGIIHAAKPKIRSSSSNATPSASLTFHNESSVAILTLRNPKRKNALTVSMMEQLDQHVCRTLSIWSKSGAIGGNGTTCSADKYLDIRQTAIENNARVVILTGDNGTFCSGLDLHDNEPDDADNENDNNSSRLKEGAHMIEHMTRVTNHLMSLPVLSVCAIDGYAVGGGAELTTCTDLVVLSRDAKIQFVHAKRGASLGWGGGRRLVKKVGRRRALRMLLLGECVHGEEESQYDGKMYADAVAEEGETALEATMRLIVDPLLDLPCSRSIRAIKNAVSAADGDGEVIDSIDGRLKMDTNIAVKGELESFLSVWGSESNKEQIQKAKNDLKNKGEKK